jgi:hypothetical protein
MQMGLTTIIVDAGLFQLFGDDPYKAASNLAHLLVAGGSFLPCGKFYQI